MDWPVTQSYVRAFSEAEEVELCVSHRERRFFEELYRIGASLPVWYEAGGQQSPCPLTPRQARSKELREKPALSKQELEELVSYGYRMKFPAKGSILHGRWCSSALKAEVANAVIRAMDKLRCDAKILLVSGERRTESPGRAKYNEMELHETNAEKKAKRLVHQWRPVIDWSERRIWEILRRHRVTPHPCYRAGWNRCSCMACIFSQPRQWAGIRELFPAEYELLLRDEKRLQFTLDNKMTLDEFTGNAKSCVCHRDAEAIQQLTTGIFTIDQIYTPYGQWQLPAGAFHGAAGGPC